MQPVEFDDISNREPGEPSAAIRQRVIAAREIQAQRFAPYKGVYCNAQMTSAMLHQFAELDEAGLKKLRDVMTRANMSARAYDRILKVARTIADLDATPHVHARHIIARHQPASTSTAPPAPACKNDSHEPTYMGAVISIILLFQDDSSVNGRR